MQLGVYDGTTIYHSVASSLGKMLEEVIHGRPVIAAHGPLYSDDPAKDRLAPFVNSAERSGWKVDEGDGLAPDHVMAAVLQDRWGSAVKALDSIEDQGEILDWSRAGLVLELGSRWGITIRGRGQVHPVPKLRGSTTGRFGYEGTYVGAWRWNPLTIPENERQFVVPSDVGRKIAVIDFRGIDVCSMISLSPGLRDRYGEIDDPHVRTAELLLGHFPTKQVRDAVKEETFIYAYGGETVLERLFDEAIPELRVFRKMEPGEAGRKVQERSARTFRSALSEALPSLIRTECRPMFVVHDELVLDVLEGREQMAMETLDLMERGASRSSGIRHVAGITWGRDYSEAKAK